MAKRSTKTVVKKPESQRAAKKAIAAEPTDRQIAALRRKQETLLPELEPYWDSNFLGTILSLIRHPLFTFKIDEDGYFALANFQYRYCQARIEEFRKNKDFLNVVMCYEKPFLLEGFTTEMYEADDKAYWGTLGWMWTSVESPWEERKTFLRLFKSKRPHRDHLMDVVDRKALKKLPDSFPIYRGFSGNRGKGLSWTLDKKIAIGFANRFASHFGDPTVIEGICQKSDVIAFFAANRNEVEIVIEPDNVKRQKRIPVSGSVIQFRDGPFEWC
jgi:hypothetical protein